MKTGQKFFDPNISRKSELVKHHLSQQGRNGTPPFFSLLEFNLCGLCNRQCCFCPRSNPKEFPNVNEHFPVELYEKVMHDLQTVDFNGSILYSAFSEPLLYKYLEDIISISKKYCPKARVEIVTNGDFVTLERVNKLFDVGLTTLCISIYDELKQLEDFQKLKKEANLKDEQLIFRLRCLPRESHFGITLSNRAGAIEMADIGVVALPEPMRQPCFYPFYQIFVDYDGSVLLCAHDWKKRLIVGNVNRESILEIWENDILKRVRVSLIKNSREFAPCDLCDVEGILVGENHFNQWREYYEKHGTI